MTVAARLEEILQDDTHIGKAAASVAEPPVTSGIGKAIVGGLAVGLGLAALNALGGGRGAEWDERVKRYRAPDGRFEVS
jgi:hypothetical protein